ncbi:hypothetical protein D3C79_855390 [compost metagenome]
MHAVQYSRVFQGGRPVAEGVCGGIPAGIDHDRRVGVLLANCRYQLPVKQRQIARSALLFRIPLLHVPQIGVLGQAALFFRGGFIDQVVGGDGRVALQFTRHVPPEGRCLGPVALVLPQSIIE